MHLMLVNDFVLKSQNIQCIRYKTTTTISLGDVVL